WYERSQSVERMTLGVERAHQLHPGQAILLDGVDNDLFWGGVAHRPFATVRVPEVYLTPESEARLDRHPELGNISDFVLPAGALLRAIKADRVVVYAVGPQRLKEITTKYEENAVGRPEAEAPRHVDAGNPLMGYLLGPGWYGAEGGVRWLGRH